VAEARDRCGGGVTATICVEVLRPVVVAARAVAPCPSVDVTGTPWRSSTQLSPTHDGTTVERLVDLSPDTEYEVAGRTVTTLPRPDGELLCRFATVNDVHFGETEVGRIDDHPEGPIMRSPEGAEPYPETMNRSAVEEMSGFDLAAVIVKGDITSDGRDDEFAAFETSYPPAFGDRLFVVRGNHDAYRGQDRYTGDQWIELPGVAVALLDTTIPYETTGTLSDEQLEWLDTCAAAAPTPVVVMGHHQQWIPGRHATPTSRPDYFGIHRDASEALARVIERRTNIVAYAAGHTHRHRVRRTARDVPSIEIGCVKDFPGTWAEYRVFEGGILQVVHRISTPEALAWSEQCRFLYADFGVNYAEYALGTLADRCFVI
jgi:predicted phosphodiesterase